MSATSGSPRASWPHNVGIPQRFSTKYQKYQELGGQVDITEDARAYAGGEPLRDVERFVFLSLVFDQIQKEGVPGDFVELGVYQGSTAAVLARHARRLKRQIYLLDTYEGFDAKDFTGLDTGRATDFVDTSLEAVKARVGVGQTTYIKGYFPQTADQLPADGRYCLVHIDTDLYAPIMAGLEYFYPRLVPGGYLIVHDYGSLTWEGAEKAVDEFFADKPESIIPIPDSCGSAVIRRIRQPGAEPSWIARRQALALDEWHTAAAGNLSHLLTEGWSAPEPWGTWGVGQKHVIKLIVPPDSRPMIDIDAHAFVWDEHEGRRVDVFVSGQPVSTLTFTKAQSFLSIAVDPPGWAVARGTLTIEFQQRAVAVPKDVDASVQDTRSLGLGIHRLRIRSR